MQETRAPGAGARVRVSEGAEGARSGCHLEGRASSGTHFDVGRRARWGALALLALVSAPACARGAAPKDVIALGGAPALAGERTSLPNHPAPTRPRARCQARALERIEMGPGGPSITRVYCDRGAPKLRLRGPDWDDERALEQQAWDDFWRAVDEGRSVAAALLELERASRQEYSAQWCFDSRGCPPAQAEPRRRREVTEE
ncbi:MAG: hypothetical protein OZ921_13825 [Sorangiineae bacterium]|nr:hypothetical protein [Polyangiaceae bacterium]MEB2323586.1 hypothetical protein [Sorangiineae bacterium]